MWHKEDSFSFRGRDRVNREMITQKGRRSPRVRSHQFRKASCKQGRKYASEQMGCEHGPLSSYDPPRPPLSKVRRRKRGISQYGSKRPNRKLRRTRYLFERKLCNNNNRNLGIGKTHSRLSDCQTCSLSSVKLHGRDVVT